MKHIRLLVGGFILLASIFAAHAQIAAKMQNFEGQITPDKLTSRPPDSFAEEHSAPPPSSFTVWHVNNIPGISVIIAINSGSYAFTFQKTDNPPYPDTTDLVEYSQLITRLLSPLTKHFFLTYEARTARLSFLAPNQRKLIIQLPPETLEYTSTTPAGIIRGLQPANLILIAQILECLASPEHQLSCPHGVFKPGQEALEFMPVTALSDGNVDSPMSLPDIDHDDQPITPLGHLLFLTADPSTHRVTVKHLSGLYKTTPNDAGGEGESKTESSGSSSTSSKTEDSSTTNNPIQTGGLSSRHQASGGGGGDGDGDGDDPKRPKILEKNDVIWPYDSLTLFLSGLEIQKLYKLKLHLQRLIKAETDEDKKAKLQKSLNSVNATIVWHLNTVGSKPKHRDLLTTAHALLNYRSQINENSETATALTETGGGDTEALSNLCEALTPGETTSDQTAMHSTIHQAENENDESETADETPEVQELVESINTNSPQAGSATGGGGQENLYIPQAINNPPPNPYAQVGLPVVTLASSVTPLPSEEVQPDAGTLSMDEAPVTFQERWRKLKDKFKSEGRTAKATLKRWFKDSFKKS